VKPTVIGIYDSYADACAAQYALAEAGFEPAEVAIYSTSVRTPVARGPRVYTQSGDDTLGANATLERLEQLFSRLFRPGEYPPEADDYREWVRRGGAIIGANVPEAQIDLACAVMRRTGAGDVEERARSWREKPVGSAAAAAPSGRSSIDEPSALYGAERPYSRAGAMGTGEGSVSQRDPLGSARNPALRDVSPSITSKPDDALSTRRTDPQRAGFASDPQAINEMQQVTTRTSDQPYSPASKQQPAQASRMRRVDPARPSEGDVLDPLYGASDPVDDARLTRPTSARIKDASGADAPLLAPLEGDDSLDDEFRTDYDMYYAESGAPYEDYRRAYSHGATLGKDAQYRGRDWQQVEPTAREDWESRYPDSTWERFKAAVRHGWERVTR
jgi:hypothetical protein